MSYQMLRMCSSSQNNLIKIDHCRARHSMSRRNVRLVSTPHPFLVAALRTWSRKESSHHQSYCVPPLSLSLSSLSTENIFQKNYLTSRSRCNKESPTPECRTIAHQNKSSDMTSVLNDVAANCLLIKHNNFYAWFNLPLI